jgi:hypothetical protein
VMKTCMAKGGRAASARPPCRRCRALGIARVFSNCPWVAFRVKTALPVLRRGADSTVDLHGV